MNKDNFIEHPAMDMRWESNAKTELLSEEEYKSDARRRTYLKNLDAKRRRQKINKKLRKRGY